MSLSKKEGLALAIGAVATGAPCVSSFLAFAGIDLRTQDDREILEAVTVKQHECLARAALAIFKENPTEWWRLCRDDFGKQFDQLTGEDGTKLLADKTLHNFINQFRQWTAVNLSKEQQDAFYHWFAAQER